MQEISALAWHAVAHLPASRDQDSQVFTNDAGGRHKFFMVWNYVRQLRRWIKARQRAAATAQVDVCPSRLCTTLDCCLWDNGPYVTRPSAIVLL